MKTSILRLLTLGVAPIVGACATVPPPATKAAAVARIQCDSSATVDQAVPLIRSTTVLHVEPLRSHVMTGNNGSEERINGAKLLIRPPTGVSPEQLTRILQCHSARLLLGQVNSADVPNDPYWLPDSWVNIDVKADDGNYLVTLSASSIEDNLAVFGRANRYADQKMLATDPGLP